MMTFRHLAFIAAILVPLAPAALRAASPKLDKETCEQLKGEKAKFVESGILDVIGKGAAWGRDNLAPERLREVQHFIMLDEQIKFGCREVLLTLDAQRAGEAAVKLEFNPNPTPEPAAEGKAPPAVIEIAPQPQLAPKKRSGTSNQKDKARQGARTDDATGPPVIQLPGQSLMEDVVEPAPKAKAQRPAAKTTAKAKDAYVPPANAPPASAQGQN